MGKRTYRQLRSAFLKALSDGEPHSFGSLERKVDTNWKTVRDHCRDLELFGAVSISKDDKVMITKEGQLVWKKMVA